MFWTLVSGVAVWTFYEGLMLWALANGYAPSLDTSTQWPWLILLVLLIPVWETTHFFL
jgi:sterol desaturase/sphingolipid hydroxylase (fatty acid hydroxylase superfamily)